MSTRFRSHGQWIALGITVTFFVHACASSKTKTTQIETAIAGPVELQGPDPSSEVGPQPVFQRPLVLILGPGMSHGFAHAGVLKALAEAHVPIGAIWGTEMGAVIGGVFSKSKSIHEFEWSLLQIKDECFLKAREKRDRCLSESIEKAIGKTEWHDIRTPFRANLKIPPSNQFAAADRGDLSAALRAGFAFREYWTEVEWESRHVESAIDARPFPVDDAKLMNVGPVMAVQVLGNKSRFTLQDESAKALDIEYGPMFSLSKKRSENELKRADFVLEVDLSDIAYFDFKKKSSAIYRGRVAVQKNLTLIKAMLGKS